MRVLKHPIWSSNGGVPDPTPPDSAVDSDDTLTLSGLYGRVVAATGAPASASAALSFEPPAPSNGEASHAISGVPLESGLAAAGIGSGGATPVQVQQAVNAVSLSVTGQGITVGVLSDSFNKLGGAAQDEADGALPPAADVKVLKEDPFSGGTDEARAMMQVVHDIAPGANLDFYTADVSEQDFANGILALAAAGAKVIVDDVTYFDEPFFQTGVIANAIQTVEQEGVIYVTSAGNDAKNGYQAAWNPIATTAFDGTTLHDTQNFGSGSPIETIAVGGQANAAQIPVVVEWNQPYGAATSHLEVLVFRNGSLFETATNTSSGEPTNPYINFNLPSGFTYQIAIENLSGPNPGLIGQMAEGDGWPLTVSVADAGTVQGHHMSPDAIAVGAVSAANTPAFGALQSETFSSSGLGTELWFNYDGSTVTNAPLDLSPVVLSGVDDISTTVSDLTDFYGTSAAAPSVAAVVADMLQENPALTFAQVEQILEESATPFGTSAVAGAGLVNAAEAVLLAAAPTLGLWHVVGAGDVNGDGHGDILWQNDNGEAGVWLMNGASVIAMTSPIDFANLGPSWHVEGSGDFNGDGKADILWQNDNGQAGVWLMSGNSILAQTNVGANPGSSWHVEGTGDFNGDGKSDILWQNTNGQAGVWLMNGTSVTTQTNVGGNPGSSWHVKGAGDFNGDGHADILWQNDNGQAGVWLMNGTNVIAQSNVGPNPGPSWHVIGTGDFNGDGHADILWQNDNGQAGIWLMNGTNVIAQSNVGANPGPSWHVIGAADFNGDGKADILWQNDNGQAGVWLMNGTTPILETTVGFNPDALLH